ncbi:hypothetical protein [Cypionkella sp.]|uniref:hypothetical protein n=1 Tax=Cypionkella sp. TaxID=2811411 RepID=UPI00271F0C6B|nr:hypothetical protein [Cypionkella sp.]MDO8986175.1 hypothetical protein [Cypionkella sp.]MDP1576765.1 hypothetical protein [Cypionkella sp.]MDP2050359.1 hypothetical protein [Cypionkella sp.]
MDDFDAVMHLNTRTALMVAKALVPGIRKLGGGRIIMTTSHVTVGKTFTAHQWGRCYPRHAPGRWNWLREFDKCNPLSRMSSASFVMPRRPLSPSKPCLTVLA